MGDRIAVMNHGRLQQVDVPETLYDNPANTFVAGFIGSPRMNFLKGRLTQVDGKPGVDFLGTSVQLPDGAHLHTDDMERDVSVGIRPEDLMWKPAAGPTCSLSVTAVVDVVEPMGHEAYVTAVCAGETVTSRFPPRTGVNTREQIELALNPARLHLFDTRTGDSILQRPAASTAEALRSAREAWIDESAHERPQSSRSAHERGAQSGGSQI